MLTPVSPNALSISVTTSSGPTALFVFDLSSAHLISSLVIGGPERALSDVNSSLVRKSLNSWPRYSDHLLATYSGS